MVVVGIDVAVGTEPSLALDAEQQLQCPTEVDGLVAGALGISRKGVANYFLLVKVTRGIASFASLICSFPRYVSGTPKGVLAIP